MRATRRSVCAIGFLCIIGVLGVACGGGGDGGGGGSTPETAFDQGTIEAQAVIDSSGGTVEVTDPSSPLYGARVQFPEGALATEETIQIIHHSDYPALPADATPNGPVVALERSGQDLFDEAVVVKLPVAQTDIQQEDEYFDVLTYDEEVGEWMRAQCWYNYEGGEMVLLVTDFSKFTSIIRSYKGPGETWTTFNMDIDTMVFQNEGNAAECPEFGGVCRGMAIFTQWVF